MDDKDKEEGEENENLRELILQQLANLESSDVSDDDSYKVRLSCILEDDESESSGTTAGQRDFIPKDVGKSIERNKESEKGPPEDSEVQYDSELGEDSAGENVQITDLDDVTLCDFPDKTETSEKTEGNVPEDTTRDEGFAIKKLKSSDNVHKRPFVVRRRELSSDSSDLDISVTNSAEGASSDLKIVEMNEGDDENTLNISPDMVESETSADEDPDLKMSAQKVKDESEDREVEVEILDSEMLSSIFAKVSRTYLEKTKGNVKWEENEKIEKVFKAIAEETAKAKGKEPQPGELSFSEVHIRGKWDGIDPDAILSEKQLMYARLSQCKQAKPRTSPKEYNPPVPPETYLWEELKRLRERGGYPWTYLDKPPFDEATWKKYMEHVYEPINPPPLSAERKEDQPRQETTKGSSIPETEKQFLRIPSDHDLVKKESEEAKTPEETEIQDITSVEKIQEDMESRFQAQTPSATSATTASQSRTDVTSSVLDSSGFEDMPVKTTLAKTRREQMRAQAQEIQQRLRNHAGRIRNKFSNMPKPTLGRKDRPARERPAEKSRFRLPEMHAPKINLPDRSKFKLPEKAKFHLPESAKIHLPDRSKFHLPEKGKFHLPERPKFNLAERAKLHLPERGKFHLPDTSKFHLPEKAKFHLPEKAKFHLPEKAKLHLPDRSKFHLPDRSKFHLPERAKFSLPQRPKIELPSFGRATREAQPSSSSPRTLKSRFEFDLKSYPKLFTKHSKDYTTSSPKQTRGRTPPPRMKEAEGPAQKSEKWIQKLDDLQYVDDDIGEGRETDSRKSESLFEREMGYMEDFEKIPQEVRTLSTKSSTSRLSERELQSSESSDDRKKGVLEEINPDEFFLRQKGISQDDIDMGKYLSREIREAFRSPDINALAKMDYMDVDDENIDPRGYQPDRPARSEIKKTKSILKKTSTSDPSISDDGYKTYPPRRPGRKSRSQSKSLLNEEAIISETVPKYEEADVNLSRYENVEYDEEDNVSEYYKSPGPAKEYQHYKVPRPHAPVSPSPPVKRKSSVDEEGSNKRIHEAWDDDEVQMFTEPPKPMARKKNKKKAGVEAESIGEEQIPQEIPKEPEEVVPEPLPIESPIPPKRTRTRSSGSRSLRSFVTDEDVNRSFQSEPPIERLQEFDDELLAEQIQPVEEDFLVKSASEFMEPRTHDYEVTDLDDVGFGYATVGKPSVTKPERHKKPKPERPPPPRRKKEISVPVYNTYPRRAPVRPLRNYSTLGPSRPPRQKRIPPIEKTLSERQFRTYAEIKSPDAESLDMIEVSGSSKDLQTEKVIEKMKGRPLPPPPRPPRQKSKGPEDDMEPTEEEKLSLSIIRDDEFPLERKVTAFVHEPPPIEREMVEEICVSTQTDPLPDDFSFGTEEGSDMIQEFSHEQLRIQQAFLEEMKREEEEMRQRGKTNESEMVDAELKAEVIRQIEDIIAEEKRILEERKNEDRRKREESGVSEPEKPGKSFLDVDADMGYASLDRRGHRQEPQTPSTPETPLSIAPRMEKLQVKELEVDSLSVREVQSDQIFVKEIQSNRVASQDIDNTGGHIALGNIDLPPSFIEQIVAKIPWDRLKQAQASQEAGTSLATPPTRPQRRQRGSQAQEDSDDEAVFQPRKSHRRHLKPQYSSDEEDRRGSEARTRRMEERRMVVGRSSESPRGIPELSLQLARACTSAGVQALRSFVQTNTAFAQSLDRELCVQAILCIAIALVAGFFLFGFDAKIVHLHRWDFQFPPQPPPNTGV